GGGAQAVLLPRSASGPRLSQLVLQVAEQDAVLGPRLDESYDIEVPSIGNTVVVRAATQVGFARARGGRAGWRGGRRRARVGSHAASCTTAGLDPGRGLLARLE
ncbi:hypothetical protein TSOC_010009, partial [Tetrabaena socialis]